MAGRLSPWQQPSLLQQQSSNAFGRLLQGPTAQERAFNVALPQIQAQLTGVPGMDILNAYQPVYQQNLNQAQQQQRQFGGPRFASESGRRAQELSERSLNDYNLFAQQVMEAGRQRQLAAAGMLGQLGGGADASRLGLTQGAGQFALNEGQMNLQQQQMQNALYQMLLGSAFTAGGYNASPVMYQTPGFWDQFLKTVGTGGALAAAV